MQRVLSLGAVVGMVAILFPGLVGAETRAVRPAQDAMGPDISVVNLSSGDVSFRITVPADYSVTRSEERPFPEARMNPPYRDWGLLAYMMQRSGHDTMLYAGLVDPLPAPWSLESAIAADLARCLESTPQAKIRGRSVLTTDRGQSAQVTTMSYTGHNEAIAYLQEPGGVVRIGCVTTRELPVAVSLVRSMVGSYQATQE